MNIKSANKESIVEASEIIKSGGLVAFPTETVYGLGADGLNPIAAAKIFEAKKRPSFNPLILHIADYSQLKLIGEIKNLLTEKLIAGFWPGPLTLVIPKKEIVPDIVTAGNETVAVRMPAHQVALELINAAGTPIAAPSANAFGNLSPTEAKHVYKQLGQYVDLILDGGKCNVGVESTILQILENEIVLLRHGGLSLEELESTVGKITIGNTDSSKPNAPGQFLQHYAPSIPLKIMSRRLLKNIGKKKVGALFFKQKSIDFDFAEIEILSRTGDLREAAANLFSALHNLESKDLDLIAAEPFEETGLGRAIMDRLRKAEYKYKDLFENII